MEQDYFDDLMRRYQENKLTPTEYEIISSWLDSIDYKSDHLKWNKKEKLHLKNRILHKLDIPSKTISLWPKVAAAVVAIMLLTGISLWQLHSVNPPENEQVPHLATITPGTSKGTLYSEEGDHIDLQTLQLDTVYALNQILVKRISENEIHILPQTTISESMQYIEAPKGGSFIIQLEDGSRLTLNANSRVSFPASFQENNRIVEAEGEVLFEVKKDKDHRPFIVKAGQNTIQVLGTVFNVKHKKDISLRTSLIEGKIVVSSPTFRVNLEPGKEIEVDSQGNYIVKPFLTSSASAWTEGYFSLDNKNIVDIMEELANWYNVEIIYNNPDLTIKYQGTISKFTDINTVLEILTLAKGNTFEIEGRQIMVK